MHLEDIAQSDIARGDGDADAAAVDERHIGLALVCLLYTSAIRAMCGYTSM